MNLGKFLHSYYQKFGEEKYNQLLARMGAKLSDEYGEAFTPDNLCIMEAEYVMMNAKIDEKTKFKSSKITIKK